MTLSPYILDELLKEYKKPEDLLGLEGILKKLTKALVERCLNAEMDVDLGLVQNLEEELRAEESRKKGKNRRNGHSQKIIKGEFGEAQINVPRDRNGEFEPQIL
jgi:putative transposase